MKLLRFAIFALAGACLAAAETKNDLPKLAQLSSTKHPLPKIKKGRGGVKAQKYKLPKLKYSKPKLK